MKTYTIAELKRLAINSRVKSFLSFLDWLEAQEKEEDEEK